LQKVLIYIKASAKRRKDVQQYFGKLGGREASLPPLSSSKPLDWIICPQNLGLKMETGHEFNVPLTNSQHIAIFWRCQ